MAITKIKNIFPGSQVARFNVAAWQNETHNTVILVGREVVKPAATGEPDIGKLVLFETNVDGEVINERVIWEPQYESFYLEDPRAMVLGDGRIVISLTAVLRTKSGVEPFPAVVYVGQQWRDILPPVTLIQTFGPGKNLTPFTDDSFLFRPEDKDSYHQLIVFRLEEGIPRRLGYFQFPTDLPWAQWRIGTTMSPLWQNDHEALLFVHGITITNGKYIYSIGVAKITVLKNAFDLQVHPEPLVTPDDFLDETGKTLVEELRPEERRVVYACGGVVKKGAPDTLHLYVNVGDRTTYDVTLSLKQIKSYFFKE